jgi:putative ABC transport system ATP-binding protein
MLRGESLFLTYQDGESAIDAVHDVTLTVEEHRFVGVLGPSGSGKSSLLYLLSGLRSATQGQVYFEDRCYTDMKERERVALRRRKFGFIFQQHFLINYLTALENVLAAAPDQSQASVERAMELLTDLGLGDKTHRFPYQLSGGERQRVAVARAMVNEPSVIFADEPTGLLDHTTGRQVMALLTPYREKGSLIVVTHDPEMLAGADRVIHLRDGEIVDETSGTGMASPKL